MAAKRLGHVEIYGAREGTSTSERAIVLGSANVVVGTDHGEWLRRQGMRIILDQLWFRQTDEPFKSDPS